MGAASFYAEGNGEDPQKAFDHAQYKEIRERAWDLDLDPQEIWEQGSPWPEDGFSDTGSVLEKDGFTVVLNRPMEDKEAMEIAGNLIRDCDPRIDDKWGPAGAIALTGGRWLFFGIAPE